MIRLLVDGSATPNAVAEKRADVAPGAPPVRVPVQGKAMKFRFGNGDQPLSGFTIKRGVGVGGFGEVYFATNDAGKEVALKQIQRNLEVEVRGVQQCMNLKHPNLIALYDIRFDDEEHGWIVMEYVSGISLREALAANPDGLSNEELERWFGQTVAGVAYLHDHGIVHRDLKPANIFEDQGIVKIGDYGLSKFISCSRRCGQTESVGTFHYMAPEIGKGDYGREIDVYALGVILYELATGRLPFDGESSQEIIMKHLTTDPDLSLLASPVREVVAQALAKNPAGRFRDVREMVRPFGMEVDDRCQLIRTHQGSDPPVVNAEARSHFSPEGAATGSRGARQANNRADQACRVTPLYYQEPIARRLQSAWLGLNHWWVHLNINPGMKTALLVVAIVFLALNAGELLPLLVLGLMFYVPYYAIWWILRSPVPMAAPAARRETGTAPMRTHSLPPTHPSVEPLRRQSPPPERIRPAAVTRPPSFKKWRAAKRMQLSQIPRRRLWSEVTGSWLGSAAVIAVFCTLAALFQIGSGQPAQPLIIGTLWSALVGLTTAWVVIGFGKRWQHEEGDWAIRCFILLTSGFAVGALAFVLAEFLMVPWGSITMEGIGDSPVHRWSGFFDGDGRPLLPAYLAYFPLLMGIIHWWKQVDPLRRARFSFWSVISSVLAATFVYLLIPFPQPWGAIIAAGASIAVQLSSPWMNLAERWSAERVRA